MGRFAAGPARSLEVEPLLLVLDALNQRDMDAVERVVRERASVPMAIERRPTPQPA